MELTLPAELLRDYLAAETLAVSVKFVDQAKGTFVEQGEIDGAPVRVAITVQGQSAVESLRQSMRVVGAQAPAALFVVGNFA